MRHEYLACQITLVSDDHAVFTVNDLRFTGKPNFDGDLQNRLRQALLEPEPYGTLLFTALFPVDSDLLGGYRFALALSRYQLKTLRIRLSIDVAAPAYLHLLEWETLYDPKEKTPLARSPDTILSRFLSPPLPLPVYEDRVRPKVLIVVSAPTDMAEYGLDSINRREIEEYLTDSPVLGTTSEITVLKGPTTLLRLRQILAEQFHVIHILAHGRPGELLLETDDSKCYFAGAEELREVFLGANLRLVCLIACSSGKVPSKDEPLGSLASTLVQLGVPAVIAATKTIAMGPATDFTTYFYKTLLRSGCLDAAANEARHQLKLSNKYGSEWSSFALFMRIPDAQIWDPSQRTPSHLYSPGDGAGILDAIVQKLGNPINVVPLVGPGINRGLLLSGPELAKAWAQEYDYQKLNHPLIDRNDLPRIAKFVETRHVSMYPHGELLQRLKEDLIVRQHVADRSQMDSLSLTEVIHRVAWSHFQNDPDAAHQVLAQLPFEIYLTTNYDGFLASALELCGRTPVRRSCLWRDEEVKDAPYLSKKYQDLAWTASQPLLFHLYGNDLDQNYMVLTDDDYLDFLSQVAKDKRHIPSTLLSKLSTSMLLFIGYDIRDLDFRVLFKGLVGQLRKLNQTRIAVLQIDVGDDYERRDEELKALTQIFQSDSLALNLMVYWGSTRQFLIDLRTRLR